MVVDTSALAAIVFGEDDAETLLSVLVKARTPILLSAMTLTEALIVVEARQGVEATQDLEQLLSLVGADVTPVDQEQSRLAHKAWRRFGKGRHPAALNLGDCFSYALARATDDALLFKGRDFAQTDIRSALA
ncbi:type II toxin-antitoxin system VapC family toxin [soil metagenome]|jgi:ribonuclease VapC